MLEVVEVLLETYGWRWWRWWLPAPGRVYRDEVQIGSKASEVFSIFPIALNYRLYIISKIAHIKNP